MGTKRRTLLCSHGSPVRLTIPETPRYTFDGARDVEQAQEDAKSYMVTKPEGDADALAVPPVPGAAQGQPAAPPKASMSDFFRHYAKRKNWLLLLGTAGVVTARRRLLPVRLGGTFSFLSKRTDDESLTVEEIQTRYFSPSQEYMTRSLELPDVAGFVTATRKRLPVYLVTGIKVAIGAKLSQVESRTKDVKAEMGASDPQGIASAGGSGGYASENTSTMGFDGSTPFVVGIRVRKIWWEKGVRKTSDKVAGPALDDGNARDKVGPVSGARFVEEFLMDDVEDSPVGKVFLNDTDDLGIEESNWVLP